MHPIAQILFKNRKMQSQEEITDFIYAVDLLRKFKYGPKIIPDLLQVFDDSTVHIPPMQSLMTCVEMFDRDVFVSYLVENTPLMLDQAHDWTRIFYAHLLHTDEDRQELRQIYRRSTDQQRSAVQQVLVSVYTGSHLDDDIRQDLYQKAQDVLR